MLMTFKAILLKSIKLLVANLQMVQVNIINRVNKDKITNKGINHNNTSKVIIR